MGKRLSTSDYFSLDACADDKVAPVLGLRLFSALRYSSGNSRMYILTRFGMPDIEMFFTLFAGRRQFRRAGTGCRRTEIPWHVD